MTKTHKVRGGHASIHVPTVIEFILDETGSMSSWLMPTITGFNTFLKEQREQPGQALLTLTKFDTAGLKTPFFDIDVKMAPELTTATFVPGGGTNLRDAIGNRIAALKARLSAWPVQPNVLIVAMTDGEDNASQIYTEHSLSSLLRDQQASGWTFVYLGATANAVEVGKRLGFPPGNIKQFEGSQMYQTMQVLSGSTTAYRATREQAYGTSEQNYFGK